MTIPIENEHRSDNPSAYSNSGSVVEVSAFKKGLRAIDLQTLRERLSGNTITRKWKRDLVEAEFARRSSGEDEDSMDDIQTAGAKRKSSPLGKGVAAVIISLCSIIILYTLYEYLMM